MTTPLNVEKIVNAYKTQVDLPIGTVLNPPATAPSRGESWGGDPMQPERYAYAAASSVSDQSGIDPILDPIHWDRVT